MIDIVSESFEYLGILWGLLKSIIAVHDVIVAGKQGFIYISHNNKH